jgi:phosphoribosylaminoimidazole-succinocarboxamide synthase
MIDPKLIKSNIPNAISRVDFKGLGKRQSGKVRDWYQINHLRILIATDRISAFDKVLGFIPFRGAILNMLSQFWFEKTRDIVQNHMIGVVDPNIMLITQCDALPVEVVVRGYITGVTDTSLWKKYSTGQRIIYGIKFPDGLKKNQKLKTPVITPTTRATGKDGHDEPITRKEIIQQKLVSETVWKQVEKCALKLYERGAKIADKAGFILADTKYEFGLDKKGKLTLIDEIHTPDSSRYWQKSSYRENFRKGEEVENYDKEFMRLWFAKQGYTGKGKAPTMPEDLIVKIAQRYMDVYEKLTEEKFVIDISKPQLERIHDNLSKLL